MKSNTQDPQFPSFPAASIREIEKWLHLCSEQLEVSRSSRNENHQKLHSVEQTIQHLQHLGLSVPSDLSELRERLYLTVQTTPSSEEAKKLTDQLGTFTEKVIDLIKQSQHIINHYMGEDFSTSEGDYQSITLQQLLASGYMSLSDELELTWDRSDKLYHGKLSPDGSIAVQLEKEVERFDSLSSAATAISGRLLNGWMCWRRVEPDGERVALDQIRIAYLKSGSAGLQQIAKPSLRNKAG